MEQLKAEREEWGFQNPQPWNDTQKSECRKRFSVRVQGWMDAGYGSCALSRQDVREVVCDYLLRFNGDRLKLHAAVVMPNHVHAVLEPLGANVLSILLKGIKGASARKANQCMATTGSFWMDESYDRIVRNQKEYDYFLDYIRENPVKARLNDDAYWLYFLK